MPDKLSPASRAHHLFRRFTLAGLSKILKPELVEDAAREFGSHKLRKRALTLPVMVWLGLHMALERVTSIEKALVSAWSFLAHPRVSRQSRFRPLLSQHTRKRGGACR